jgi:hypothetical protein
MAVNRGDRRGYDFGATSENPEGLRRDDGGLWNGAVDEDHIDCRPLTRPQRGSGFSNSERDYGPRDMSTAAHVDGSHTRPAYPSGAGYTPQPDRRGPGASVARAKAGSDSEWWPDEWYGYPAKRQGG